MHPPAPSPQARNPKLENPTYLSIFEAPTSVRMKKTPFVALALLCMLTACKKSQQTQSPKLVNISVEGQTAESTIASTATFKFLIGDNTDLTKVPTHFTLNPGNKALLNNTELTDGATIDFSQAAQQLKRVSGDKSISYTIDVQKEWPYFGIAGNVTVSKSLNRNYNFYFDQFDGSTLQAINCGPAVTTMAIKWADQTYTGTPLQARTDIYANGDWWYTDSISKYLDDHGVSNTTVMISDFDNLIKSSIDNNKLVILCLDMYSFIDYNNKDYQHTNKFYQTLNAGWGHFLLVKGYKQTTTGLYLEVYDPYTNHRVYEDDFSQQIFGLQQPKGKDRYYPSSTIAQSAHLWWPYVIVVAPKGQAITTTAVTGGRTVHPSQIKPARGQ